jgi:hypothetical protein
VCAATVAEGAVWCSLCHADLRPAERVGPPVAAAASARGRHAKGRHSALALAPRDDAPSGPPTEVADPARPGPPVAPLPPDEELFELLRRDLADDRLGSWSQRISEPRVKWGIAVGGAVVLVSVLVLLAGVFGSTL